MKKVKKSIITKRITEYKIDRKIKRTYMPKAGDVALFEVVRIGKHKALQSENGTNAYIFPGDRILATFGTRYASAQFEGYVPTEYQRRYQILGQGGVVGTLKSQHAKFDDIGATEVKLIGYAINDKGKVINTKYHDVIPVMFQAKKQRDYQIYLSIGASMDSGKTTTAAYLSRGFMNKGKKVGFIKLTGTVYAKDCSFVRDCGARTAVDFSYCGYPSTYLCKTHEILTILETLFQRVERIKPDVVVIEIADGLLQRETKALIEDRSFMNLVDGIVLSCADSLSIASGLDILEKQGHSPMCLSGLFTASPLMVKEVRDYTLIPVFTLEDFCTASKFDSVFSYENKLMHANGA